MKKVLVLLAIAFAVISCSKDASVTSDQQRGRKVKAEALTVSLATSVVVDWTPEDNIISIDSAKPVIENVGAGTNVYWSVRADSSMLPQINIAISVWEDSATIGGVFHPAHWGAIGNHDAAVNAPGGAGKIFSGYTEAGKVYRAAFWGKNFVWHYSSPYQVN